MEFDCSSLPAQTVFIVDVYDCGAEHAFYNRSDAKAYVSKRYIDNLDKSFAWSIERGISAEEVVNQIKTDLVQLRDEGYIEEYAYIYEVPVI